MVLHQNNISKRYFIYIKCSVVHAIRIVLAIAFRFRFFAIQMNMVNCIVNLPSSCAIKPIMRLSKVSKIKQTNRPRKCLSAGKTAHWLFVSCQANKTPEQLCYFIKKIA